MSAVIEDVSNLQLLEQTYSSLIILLIGSVVFLHHVQQYHD